MSLRTNLRPLATACACLALAGCGGLFKSTQSAPVVYLIRATPGAALAPAVPGALVVLRPFARPGLESDRIAVTLPDRRLDTYAASRWSAPLPDLVQSLLLDDLRARGGFGDVLYDRGEFAGRYVLQTEIRDFQAEYAAPGTAPTVRVTLRGALGRPGERRPLGTVTASGTVAAASDRLRDVVAAFESACAQATATLGAEIHAAALAADEAERSASPDVRTPRVPAPSPATR